MKIRPLPVRALAIALMALLAAGCAPRESGSAREAIDRIDAAIAAAGPDATKYLPSHVSAVKAEVVRLKVKFYDRDYRGVLDAAPRILEQAEGLPATAAAKKSRIASMLNGDWAGLETSVPAALDATGQRVDTLLASGTLPAGLDKQAVDSARSDLAGQRALWEKATAAKASGDLEQAVALGMQVQRKAATLLAALGGH
jgi:hypothetical protein